MKIMEIHSPVQSGQKHAKSHFDPQLTHIRQKCGLHLLDVCTSRMSLVQKDE